MYGRTCSRSIVENDKCITQIFTAWNRPNTMDAPSFSPRLLPSSVAVWNESKILARIMYKIRNQHRSTHYFRKFQQVSELLVANIAHL